LIAWPDPLRCAQEVRLGRIDAKSVIRSSTRTTVFGAQEPLQPRRTRRCLVPYIRIGHEVRLNHREPSYGIPDEGQLWVGEADQARPPQIPREFEHARIDFLIMEVSALRDQLARMPTRGTSPARRSGSSSRLRSSAPCSAGGSSRADGAADRGRRRSCRWPADGLDSFGWRAKTGSAPDRFHTALSACRRHP